jgi:hypothetical protein
LWNHNDKILKNSKITIQGPEINKNQKAFKDSTGDSIAKSIKNINHISTQLNSTSQHRLTTTSRRRRQHRSESTFNIQLQVELDHAARPQQQARTQATADLHSDKIQWLGTQLEDTNQVKSRKNIFNFWRNLIYFSQSNYKM